VNFGGDDDAAYGVALQGDGKIVLAGQTNVRDASGHWKLTYPAPIAHHKRLAADQSAGSPKRNTSELSKAFKIP
jgi:hypothetical protein